MTKEKINLISLIILIIAGLNYALMMFGVNIFGMLGPVVAKIIYVIFAVSAVVTALTLRRD